MAEIGKPISEAERRNRPLEHLLLYGIKMMVRRDIGGRDDIGNHATVLGNKLVGKTAAAAGQIMADELNNLRLGIRERQKRTVEELERRQAKLESALIALTPFQTIIAESKTPTAKAMLGLINAANELLYGEGAKCPALKAKDPLDHVLV